MGGSRRIYWSKPKPSGTTAMSPQLQKELGYDPHMSNDPNHFSISGVDKRYFDFAKVPQGNESRTVQFDNGGYSRLHRWTRMGY